MYNKSMYERMSWWNTLWGSALVSAIAGAGFFLIILFLYDAGRLSVDNSANGITTLGLLLASLALLMLQDWTFKYIWGLNRMSVMRYPCWSYCAAVIIGGAATYTNPERLTTAQIPTIGLVVNLLMCVSVGITAGASYWQHFEYLKLKYSNK